MICKSVNSSTADYVVRRFVPLTYNSGRKELSSDMHLETGQ